MQKRTYTSASEINCLLDSMSAWFLQYRLGYRTPQSEKMKRGLDVEFLLARIINGAGSNEVIKQGETMLDEVGLHMLQSGIIPIRGLAEFAVFPFDDPEDGQWKIRYHPAGGPIDLPILGYLDFMVPAGVPGGPAIIDIKTTENAPSKFPTAHARQAAIYRQAFVEAMDGLPPVNQPPHVTFVYLCKRKKNPVVVFSTDPELEVEEVPAECVHYVDLDFAWNEVASTLETLETLHKMPRDRLRAMIPVSTDHYRFNGYDSTIIEAFRAGELEPYEPPA